MPPSPSRDPETAGIQEAFLGSGAIFFRLNSNPKTYFFYWLAAIACYTYLIAVYSSYILNIENKTLDMGIIVLHLEGHTFPHLILNDLSIGSSDVFNYDC